MHVKDGPHMRQLLIDLMTSPDALPFAFGLLLLVVLYVLGWVAVRMYPRFGLYLAQRERMKLERRADHREGVN